tara:strand:+ start:323 stop:757 length:435 start_codon:yes stop_codon:yes gene_type:complete
MGKLLPVPYPGQSMDEYREQLVNFQKNYWSFLKPSKGGSKFIPLPPLTLIKKTKEMSSKKLSEHVEEELFNKEKRVTTPKITKEPVLGETTPVKKKKPYYRKKYNKPTPVEVVAPEPVNQHLFIKGLLVGSVVTAIICHIIYSI